MSVGAQLLQAAWSNNALPWIQAGANIAAQKEHTILAANAQAFDSTMKLMELGQKSQFQNQEIALKRDHFSIDQQNADTQRMFAEHRLGVGKDPTTATVTGGVYGPDGLPIAGAQPQQPVQQQLVQQVDQNTPVPLPLNVDATPEPATTLSPEALKIKQQASDNAETRKALALGISRDPNMTIGAFRESTTSVLSDWKAKVASGMVTDPDALARANDGMQKMELVLGQLKGLGDNLPVKDHMGFLDDEYQKLRDIANSKEMQNNKAAPSDTVAANGGPGLLPPAKDNPLATDEAKKRVGMLPDANTATAKRIGTVAGNAGVPAARQTLEGATVQEGQSVIYPSPTNRSVRIFRAGGKLFQESVEVTGKRADGSQAYKSVSTAHEIKEPNTKAANMKPSLMSPEEVAKVQEVQLLPEGKAAVTYVDRNKDEFKTVITSQKSNKATDASKLSEPEKAVLKQASAITTILDKAATNKDVDPATVAQLRQRVGGMVGDLVEKHPELKPIFAPYLPNATGAGAGASAPKQTPAQFNSSVLRLLTK